MNSCIVKKKDMSAVCCYAKGNQYNIPKGVRILRKHSFANCRAKKVNIPTSVKKIEGAVFSYKYWKEFNRDIEDVTVAKNSKYYARDGRTIYNKKDKSLSIAILKSKNGKSTYVMSDKVKFLNANQNVVNYKDWEEPESWDSYKARKKYIVSEYAIYLSKNLKRATVDGWYITRCLEGSDIYFKSKNAPKCVTYKRDVANSQIAYDQDVYVPKKSAASYKKMFKKNIGNHWNKKVDLKTY